MSAFDHPASGSEACFGLDFLGLFAPASDVRCESKLFGYLADLWEVVTLIHAHPATGHWNRSLDLDSVKGLTDQFEVVTVGTLDDHGDGNPLGFSQKTAFDTLLAPVRRISTRFFDPDRGALLIAPSMDSHDQSTPSTWS